jgi:hypothetical protein
VEVFLLKIVFSFALVTFTEVVSAQCPVPPANTPSASAKQLTISKLGQFLKCDANDPLNDQSPCNTFASRGLESIYGIKEFKSGEQSHQSANQMWDTANASGSKWVKLGGVFNEQNNLCAQSMANTGWPVIALLKASGHGHVALIIPGEPQKSGTWSMLAANSASFFLDDPDSAYLNKPLSNAFGNANAQNASFFYRKP